VELLNSKERVKVMRTGFCLVFCLGLSLFSCGKPYSIAHVMKNYRENMVFIADEIRHQNLENLKMEIQTFRKFIQTEQYRKWINSKEPNSRQRYAELTESLETLDKATRQTNRRDMTDVKANYMRLRQNCLECHYRARMGINYEFFEKEIPDLVLKN
jgi:hypothetical protein